MAKNIIVISSDLRETRVALIEDGIIAELHIERKSHPSAGSVGDVVLGKVTRVLPGLQAAFVEVGQERAAFLHVEDLIRPDDFETYLAGGRKHAMNDDASPAEDEVKDDDAAPVAVVSAASEAIADATPGDRPSLVDVQAEAEALAEAEGDDAGDDDASEGVTIDLRPAAAVPDAEGSMVPEEEYADAPIANGSSTHAIDEARGDDAGDGADANDSGEVDAIDGEWDEESESEVVERPASSQVDVGEAASGTIAAAPVAKGPTRAARAARTDDSGDLGLNDDLPGFTITEPGEPVPRAPVAPRAQGPGGRGRRRGRGRGRSGDDRGPARTDVRGPNDRGPNDRGPRGGGGGDRGGRGRDGGRDGRSSSRNTNGAVPNRISKSTPIRDVVREGQEIIVQISKDPIGTKGARCTSHISLPGRYVVYLPTVDHIGVSKRIGSERERARLRETIEGMKPPSGGLIVRTVAEGLTKKQLKADVGYLVRLWGEIAKKREGAHSPTQLWSELDLVLKTARDLFTDEIDEMVVDDKVQYERLCRFVEMFAPERVKDITYYSESEPIFDEYGIEDEIGRALSRKVPLPSGGHLVIDQAEALTAIDVNTGRYVGKGAKDLEDTILKTNLEAVHEIAYQLRFRNIGGLIILDLIDMENRKNRETVRHTLEGLLEKDKAKTTLNRISELGLIEMTRKRTRESLGRLLHEPCFYCDGTGQLQSKETVAYEILREIRRKHADLPGYAVVVNVHPAVADLLTGPEKAAVAEAENKYMRKITVVPRKDYHLEQFDLNGK
jgi:ribonuclease G